MEKEENLDPKIETTDTPEDSIKSNPATESQNESENDKLKKEITPEEKIKELEDKIVRTFAEMENQRRRFEKEKNDAFEYGGFALSR